MTALKTDVCRQPYGGTSGKPGTIVRVTGEAQRKQRLTSEKVEK
ncbi:hypothetical protein ACIP2Y_43805 [Streptomyces sviceus]